MATITLTWQKNTSGGTPTNYKIYRRIGDHEEAAVKLTPDATFPVTQAHVDANATQTWDDTNAASQSEYSYTVTAVDQSGVETAPADNETSGTVLEKNITA